ncbi:MAG: Ig-like domain-containing protein [Bacteroidota bacterium]
MRSLVNIFSRSGTKLCVATFFICYLALGALCAQKWSIQRDSSAADYMVIRVWSLFAERSSPAASLQLFPGDTVPDELPPMLGQYWQDLDTLFFRPRFPYQRGQVYQLYLPERGKVFSFQFGLAERSAGSVPLQVYPSTDTLPANQLKFYLAFRDAMALQSPYHHIWLEDANGQKLKNVFLEIDPALWGPYQRRLTLWFEPGRIKRGLIPYLAQGPPLQAGNRYTLVVNTAGIHDPQRTDTLLFRHSFWVKEADRQRPDVETWSYGYPKVGSRDTFSIYFPEPMDYALLQSDIFLLSSENTDLPGQVIIGKEERSYHFVPKQAWRETAYTLMVSSSLEDLAANNFARLFDTDKATSDEHGGKPFWLEHHFSPKR